MSFAAPAPRMNPDLDLLYPLNQFYELSGLPLPSVTRVEGLDVPEPYRTLLVHQRDMTPTLAEAYGRDIQLRVIRKDLSDRVYARQIVLETAGNGKAVLFGAIKIYLHRFPPAARRLVLAGKQPLGGILQSEGVAHTSRPEAYIRVEADAVIEKALALPKPLAKPPILYGRRNALWDSSQQALAQVVEILPPSGPRP
jgi:chorismate-pyruvate lyase